MLQPHEGPSETSHPNLGRYWTWMEAPSTGYSLTPTAARVWYACDGTLSFGGSSDVPQVVFTATADAKRAAIRQLLAQRGFQPMEWERRVALPREKTKPWLEWIGKPAPGSEYKWCTDEATYRRLRRDVTSSVDWLLAKGNRIKKNVATVSKSNSGAVPTQLCEHGMILNES